MIRMSTRVGLISTEMGIKFIKWGGVEAEDKVSVPWRPTKSLYIYIYIYTNSKIILTIIHNEIKLIQNIINI